MPIRRIEQAEPLEPSEASQEEDARLLQLRKDIEFECVKKYDTVDEMQVDFWYIMDIKWLNAWANFVTTADGAEPGPITTKELLDSDLKPLAYIQCKIDYRCVCPMMYHLLREFHGKDTSPEICRYGFDINGIDVQERDRLKVQASEQKHASAEGKRLRVKWLKPLPLDEEEDQRVDCCGCCNLTKEHVETLLYWMLMCCYRRRDDRKNISYRQYMPLTSNRGKRRKKKGSVATDDDDLRSLWEDESTISNAELGHSEGGHWLRNLIVNKDDVLR